MPPKTLFTVCFLIIIIGGFWPFSAFADEDEIQKLYDEGQFSSAAKLGEEEGSVHGLLLASQAYLVMATYQGDHAVETHLGRAELVRKARALSLSVTSLNESNILAVLNIVITSGLLNRLDKSSLKEKIKKAKVAKKKLLWALQQDGDHPLVHATLAAWHGEVIDQAGGLFGRIIFGASRKKLRQHYQKAMALAPKDIPVKLEYIKYTLSRLKKIRNKNKRRAHVQRVQKQLEEILLMPTQRAVERLAQGHARQLLKVVKQGSGKEISRKLRHLTLVLNN